MENEIPVPRWMHNFEVVTVILSVLCVLSVFAIIALHLWFRSACFSLNICA